MFRGQFLNAQHRVIALQQVFRGAVTQNSVYPCELVNEVLGCNAAAVILVHTMCGCSIT